MWRHVAWSDKSISAATFWMVGLETWGIHRALYQCFRLLLVALWCRGCFLGTVSQTIWILLLTISIPLWSEHIHLLMAASHNTSCHKAQILSNWYLGNELTFTVIRCQSNRAPLGCGETGDSHHGCTADKAAGLSEECFQECFVESRQQRMKAVLKATGVQPTTSKV